MTHNLLEYALSWPVVSTGLETPRLESSTYARAEERWLKDIRKFTERNPWRVPAMNRKKSSANLCEAHTTQTMQPCRHLAAISTMVWGISLGSGQAVA